ncbi:sodium-dependent glucose transporter 1-like [Oppia nitens]|uniref:sodium-dependent glucose transporter 1-like n=1 Tax=Oppia nitens TaxID=1686743 RepID=UPI0023DAF9E8|nr:sodium-dependent glucose transporter 1-like [Oppia nitens]
MTMVFLKLVLKRAKRILSSTNWSSISHPLFITNYLKLISDKYIYTGIICLIQLSYGYSCSSFGPSFVDLKHIFNSSMNEISIVTTFNSFGYMVGSLCGLVIKHINKRLALVLSLVLMSVSVIAIPHSQHLQQLYLFFWLFGFGSGVYVNVKYVWLIDMWQEFSAPILHLAGFMFGIGHTLGPLIEKSYLTGEVLNDFHEKHGLLHKNNLTALEEHMLEVGLPEVRRQKLVTPFLICGLFHIISPILLTIIFRTRGPSRSRNVSISGNNNSNTISANTDNNSNIKDESDDQNSFQIIANNTAKTNGSVTSNEKVRKKLFETLPSQKITMIIMLAALLAFFSAGESIFFAFSATYFQYIPLKLSAGSAAQLVSMIALTFTVSRGVAILLAIRTSPQQIIAIFLSILIVSMFMLFFATNSLPLLWLSVMMMSFGYSPVYASVFAFMGRYLEFTNSLNTVMLLSANSLNLVLPGLLGTYIEVMPNIYLLTMLFCTVITNITSR